MVLKREDFEYKMIKGRGYFCLDADTFNLVFPKIMVMLLLLVSVGFAQNYTALSLANQSFCDNFGDGGS